MKHTARTVIDRPADRIDLAQWLSTMTDREYQACSRAHRGAGALREGKIFGMVNIESIGGHLLVQHYLAREAAANRVLMHSANTRVYILHVFPATIEVSWSLAIQPKGRDRAELACTVEALMAKPLAIIASSGLLPLFLKWHVEEETARFAADIERKVADPTGSIRTKSPRPE